MKKKLVVSDRSPSDVVVSMANELEADYIHDKYEYKLILPKKFGDGYVRAVEFPQGVGTLETNYTLVKDFHFTMEKGVVHPLKFIFNIGDNFFHKLEGDSDFTEIQTLETFIVASTPFNNHHFMVPSGTRSLIFTLEVNRKLFENVISDFSGEMDRSLEELFRDVNGVVPFAYKASYSHTIGELIDEYRNCLHSGVIRKLYLESKANEILSNYLAQYIDDTNQPEDREIFRSNHLKFVKKASQAIKQHLETPLSINELSKEVGLGPKLLQNGFKAVYGKTINEYVQNERLKMAERMILETDMTISEITYAIGLTSKSYFSKVFGNKFGMSPKTFRDKHRQKRGS